ncbi:hypothetical protein AVEN_223398-1 [Araneus ventricosus]|uniref:C2H2-type domain-containing protein n=1 Tax=Araneus ventricosus TaxID=182803 RepID=A0A4Y2P047_ARAVE|nr:hypothetical protein AVEN_223398-1 [Araneus ventricosus]
MQNPCEPIQNKSDQCCKEFSHNYRRKRAPTSKKGFKCWKCRKEFANESEFISHMQNHDKPKQNKSERCSKKISHNLRVNKVPEHEIHTSQQQTRIEGGENSLRKRVPTSKKAFKCWKCRKGFTNELELKIHMQNPCEPI